MTAPISVSEKDLLALLGVVTGHRHDDAGQDCRGDPLRRACIQSRLALTSA
jgi:hypothetical protein